MKFKEGDIVKSWDGIIGPVYGIQHIENKEAPHDRLVMHKYDDGFTIREGCQDQFELVEG